MEERQTRNVLEACLLVAGRAMPIAQLEALFEEDIDRPDRKAIRAALAALAEDYAERGIELVEVAGGWRLQTRAAMAHWVARLSAEKAPRYSRALLETLVLIAYRQPITRGEIEEVRGVAVSSNIVRTLQERRWVREVGHKDVPGRPALLGTTGEFLDYFNLKRLDELPPLGELKDLDRIEAVLAAELGVVDGAGEAANDGEAASGADATDGPHERTAADADGASPMPEGDVGENGARGDPSWMAEEKPAATAGEGVGRADREAETAESEVANGPWPDEEDDAEVAASSGARVGDGHPGGEDESAPSHGASREDASAAEEGSGEEDAPGRNGEIADGPLPAREGTSEGMERPTPGERGEAPSARASARAESSAAGDDARSAPARETTAALSMATLAARHAPIGRRSGEEGVSDPSPGEGSGPGPTPDSRDDEPAEDERERPDPLDAQSRMLRAVDDFADEHRRELDALAALERRDTFGSTPTSGDRGGGHVGSADGVDGAGELVGAQDDGRAGAGPTGRLPGPTESDDRPSNEAPVEPSPEEDRDGRARGSVPPSNDRNDAADGFT